MKKKYLLLLLFCCSTFFVSAQDGRVPDREKIKQLHIKTISAKLSTGPNVELLRDKWTFDKDGNMISHQLFDETDTVLHIERFIYSNQFLREKHVVAHMNFSVNHADSVITTYSYNTQNELTEESAIGFKVHRSIQYINANGIPVKKIYFDNGQQIKTDSLLYFPDKKLHQVYFSKSNSVATYSYTPAGLMETQQENAVGDTAIIFNFSKYYYKGNSLVKQIEGFSWNGKPENLTDEEYQFEYDEKQLLKEIKRIRKNVVINSEKYYYTFW